MEYNSIKNQDIKRKFVEREVVYNVSTLVYELASKADEFPDYSDDLYGAFQGLPDYEEAAMDHGWSELGEEKEIDGEFCMFFNQDTGEYSKSENWQGLCDEVGIDTEDYEPDIYEHWIVSDYLASKLEEHNHKVLYDFFGMTVWCRPTTGQAILLDGVISEICAEMEILEGQTNDWSKAA